jgi:LacI family transcriptional regulator
VGFDVNVWTENFSPSVTAIAHPTSELGRQAIAMLLKRIRGEGTDAAETVLLKGELQVRESTGPCSRVHILARV